MNIISQLIAAYRRGKVAHHCSSVAFATATKLIEQWKDGDPPQEVKDSYNFWLRASNRYHRVSIGQSPWRRLNFVQD